MAKGIKTGGGSRKGKPNKASKALKEMILGALEDVGGQAYLARQAQESPASFLTLIGKVLPLQLAAEGTDPIAAMFADTLAKVVKSQAGIIGLARPVDRVLHPAIEGESRVVHQRPAGTRAS